MIKTKVSEHYRITEEGFINHGIILKNKNYPIDILTSDYQRIPTELRGWLYLLSGPSIHKVICYHGFCPDTTIIPPFDGGKEIIFIIYSLREQQYNDILLKCQRDKILYDYCNQDYLYKIPKTINTYMIDRLYDMRELYMYIALSNRIIDDCICYMMNIYFNIKIADKGSYRIC